ncbi:MAG: isoleucine--tRNA ligase [Candidatus Woesearchaeota archaeon]
MEKYDFKQIEPEIRVFWRRISLLKLLEEQNRFGERYFLLDGPPFPNNVPHVGHVRNTVYKDLYIRLNFMRGKNVFFQPGFDTHGLPVENMIEKKLKLESKKDIETFGIARFVQECREHAALYKDIWMKSYDNLGCWYSWREPYMTFDNSYLESAWWAFKKIWDRGMVYEGKKPIMWCPHCQTALAGYEVTDSYKNLSDPGVIVKFKLKDTKDDYLLVFTTTPWTLPSNTVICAHPDKEYVKVQTEKDGNLILAKNCLKELDRIGKTYKVIGEFRGKTLDNLYYEPLLDLPQQKELQKNPKALRVYMSIPILKERVTSKVATKKEGLKARDVFGDFVSVDEGTGFVHCVPGAGKTDNEVGKHYGLPDLSPLDDSCRFTDEAGKYSGMYVKDADHIIAEDLHQSGKLLYFERIEHSYPVCWRCKAPLIFRMSNQWFFKVDVIKERMLEENENLVWQPDYAKDRFSEWVSNAEDWNFSMQRYWGIPIPVWKCSCGEIKVIGSLEELKKNSVEPIPEDFDLHTASLVALKCPECGAKMPRINDILNGWFDSGVAPWASMGYPFQNKELFEKHFPVDRINESQDQIRGWFYSLMFCSVGAFDKPSFKKVSMPGWVVDKNGEKFSKSLGNGVSTDEAIEKIGADALRFYYCWDIAPYSLQKFNLETAGKEIHKMINILWNLQNFLLSESSGEDFSSDDSAHQELKTEDQWILSRFNSTLKTLLESYESYELHTGGRKVFDFIVNDLSRTYVQSIRDRIEDEKTPLYVINHCLLKLAVALAPVIPFVSEKIYQNLKQLNKGLKESVHLDMMPVPEKSNETLEKEFEVAQELIASLLAARDKALLGVRWPVEKIVIDLDDVEAQKCIGNLRQLVEQQTNVRKIEFGRVSVKLKIKPDYKKLGKDFGTDTGDVATLILKDDGSIINQLEQKKENILVGKFIIKPEHLVIEEIPPDDYSSAEFRKGTVYLYKELSPELKNEGFAREIMRRVQAMRKDLGLDKKNDKIELMLEVDDDLKKTMEKNIEGVKAKVGALSLTFGTEHFDNRSEEKIKDRKIVFSLKKD